MARGNDIPVLYKWYNPSPTLSQHAIPSSPNPTANEWLGKSKGSREVQLKITDPATVQTLDLQGKHLRSVCFSTLHHVTARHANDKGGRTLVLHVPKEHDLVSDAGATKMRATFPQP